MSALEAAKASVHSWAEGKAILEHYGDRRAKRSQVPLINHIYEGVAIIQNITDIPTPAQAFCLHPLYQSDTDLVSVGVYQTMTRGNDFNPLAILYAMEYRSVANAFLSGHVRYEIVGDDNSIRRIISQSGDIQLSEISHVNDMLIADKVQNRKDFLAHHFGTHANSNILDAYFRLWMERLGIDDAAYQQLTGLLK